MGNPNTILMFQKAFLEVLKVIRGFSFKVMFGKIQNSQLTTAFIRFGRLFTNLLHIAMVKI